MRHALSLFIVSMTLALILASCVPDARSAVSGDAMVAGHAAASEPKLRAGDKVQVTVFGEESLSGTFELSANGTLQLPLAGAVPAAGRDTHAVEGAIAAALRRTYLRDPKVTVAVVSQRPFYMLGEVEKPGEYPYREGLNLWRALAVAGGQTYRASTAAVMIQHAGEERLAEVDTSHDILIEPGDLIRVPERWF